jgi:hypothetical protein
MSALSNFDIFGWMTVAVVFALPLAWVAGREDAIERAVRARVEKLTRRD